MRHCKDFAPAFFVLLFIWLPALSPVSDSYASSCAPAPPGIVSWWGGDNNALDVVGTNNGTFAANTYGAGWVGNAFILDGVDDKVSVPYNASLDFAGGDFSVDAWVYPSTIDSFGEGIAGRLASDNGSGWGFAIQGSTYGSSGKLNFFGNDWVGQSVGTVATNAWTHVAVTRSGNTITYYINGVPSGAYANANSTGNFNNGLSLLIGDMYPDWAGSVWRFSGLMDEVGIHSRALSADEIQAIYSAGSAGVCRNCTPTPSGALSSWKAEDNAKDSVGTNNGTVNGANYETGKVGRAFSFDGTGDYVTVPDSASLDVTATISIAAWIYRNDGTSEAGLLKKGAFGSNGVYSLALYAHKFYFRLNGDNLNLPSVATIPVGTWTHVAGTYDGTTAKIYINGILDATQPYSASVATDDNPLYIGLYGATTKYFPGLIDELEIFNRALTADEIAAIYNASSAGTCPSGIISWWKGDGDAVDFFGVHNGTLQGGMTFAPGVNGQAFSLDGVDDHVALGDWFNYQTFTIDLWVNPGSTQRTYANILDNNHTDSRSWVLQQNADIQNEYGWGPVLFTLPAHQWTHLAITREGSTRITTVYKDGTSMGNYASPGDINYDGTQFFHLGTWGGICCTFLDRHWNGLMDDVRVFDRALPFEEVNLMRGPDSIPSAFTFADQAYVAFNTIVTSNEITVSGINVPVGISITGGEYSVDGGAYTSAAGTVNYGDKVAVRQTSAGTYFTTTDATLTIGGVSDTFSVTTVAQCGTPQPGLVAFWKGENNARDSISDNDGMLMNGATYSAGKVGQAFSFDGSGAYVDFGSNSVFEITDDVTVDAWIKVNAGSTSNGYIIGKCSCVSDAHQSYMLYQIGNIVAFFVNGPNGDADLWVYGVTNIKDGQWHHVAGTFSRTGGGNNLKIYVDGGLDNQATTAAGGMYAASGWPVTAGAGPEACPSDYFNGLVDEIQIFNRVLSVSEISSIYNAGSAGTCAPDTTPDVFTFTERTGIELNTPVTSNTIPVSGINPGASITITGGEYSIGCTETFTNTAGTIAGGDTVCVRQTSSSDYFTITTATLTIGDRSADFNVRTLASQNLTVQKDGNGNGTVSSSPAGIDCGLVCSAAFGQGGTVTLQATPAAHSYLSVWGGDCTGGGQVTIGTADAVCTATFARYPVLREETAGYFMTIGEAYGNGSTPYTIRSHGVELTDSNLNLSGTADVVIDGGYQEDFTLGYSGSLTVITGPLTIGGTGSVSINNIAVK